MSKEIAFELLSILYIFGLEEMEKYEYYTQSEKSVNTNSEKIG